MSRKIITTVAASSLIALSLLSSAVPASAQNTDPSSPSIILESESATVENQAPYAYVTPDSGSQVAASPAPGELSQKEKELVDSIMTPEERKQLEKEKRDFGTAILAAVMGLALATLAAGVLVSRSIRGRKINEAKALDAESEAVAPDHNTSS